MTERRFPDTRPPSAPAEPATVVMPAPVEKPAAGLTVNNVLAGAGAAATSAVLGSYLGAAGTVAGAAIGSVASTVATTIYQRSLDRTRETVATRIRVRRAPGGAPGVAPDVTVPLPRVSPEETTVLRPAPPPKRRRRIVQVGLASVVFVLGLLVVTGVEWVKGSTITGGQAGTSVGRVVAPPPPVEQPAPADGSTAEEHAEDEDAEGSQGVENAEPSAEPSATDEPADGPSTAEPGPERGSDGAEATTEAPDATPTAGPEG